MARFGWVLGLALVGCGPHGEGRVDARFSTPECPPGTRLGELEDYGWDAGYLATERFETALIVQVQKHDVDIVETDSVSFRLDLAALEKGGVVMQSGEFYRLAASPTTLSAGRVDGQIAVLLGLYRTCPRFPNYRAVSGTVELDVLAVRVDGEDTGDGERIVGRVVTASVGAPGQAEALGVVDARFDFEPPSRPLREFE